MDPRVARKIEKNRKLKKKIDRFGKANIYVKNEDLTLCFSVNRTPFSDIAQYYHNCLTDPDKI